MKKSLLPAIATALALLATNGAQAAEQPFETWLAEVRTEARQKGIKDEIIAAALTGIQPIPRIIELDR